MEVKPPFSWIRGRAVPPMQRIHSHVYKKSWLALLSVIYSIQMKIVPMESESDRPETCALDKAEFLTEAYIFSCTFRLVLLAQGIHSLTSSMDDLSYLRKSRSQLTS